VRKVGDRSADSALLLVNFCSSSETWDLEEAPVIPQLFHDVLACYSPTLGKVRGDGYRLQRCRS